MATKNHTVRAGRHYMFPAMIIILIIGAFYFWQTTPDLNKGRTLQSNAYSSVGDAADDLGRKLGIND